MPEITLLLIAIIVIGLIFDFTNGFHDTANAIATVVATRVLTPQVAVLMAGGLNLIGAFFASRVAQTIESGLIDTSRSPHVTQQMVRHVTPGLTDDSFQVVILAAIVGALVWNLITWYFGIPSSSSHALVGGLVGASIVYAGTGSVLWGGLWHKVVIPMVLSPLTGLLVGFCIMGLIYKVVASANARKVGAAGRHLQLFSAALMAFSHGSNDAQKTMGIITMALVAEGLHSGPGIPKWVICLCAIAMALGTLSGGYRIMKTMGHKIMRLEPIQGFAAETTAATVILGSSWLGFPVSTTHVVTGSIFGVGSARRPKAVRWGLGRTMVVAWVLTLPAAGLVGGLTYLLLRGLG
jgi:PiT family inorganic phosphate transporter